MTDIFFPQTFQQQFTLAKEEDVIGVALSGGANRGALQAGALQALLEHGIMPQIVTGTSAGALNGAWFCAKPTLAGIEELKQLWLATKREDVFPGNYFTWAIRFLLQYDAPIPNTGLIDYIRKNLPIGMSKFGDLQIPLHVVATDLLADCVVIYGDDRDSPLVEPLAASAAFPGFVEPVIFDDMQLSDGGLKEFLPITLAADLGATTVYAIDLSPHISYSQPLRGWPGIISRELMSPISEQAQDDLQDLADDPAVDLHHILITALGELDLFDFSHTAELIEAGYQATNDYLKNPHPNQVQEYIRFYDSALDQ